MKFYLTALTCILACGSTKASIIHVPSEHSTIQSGIDGAFPGDTVLVADGTYSGLGNRDLDFGGKEIIVVSENGPEFTIIDCQGGIAEPHRKSV